MELHITLAILAFLSVVVLVFLYLSVRIVQPDELMVIFRLGMTNESLVRGPGLRFLIPVIDRPVRIALGTEGVVQAPLNPTGTARLAGVTLQARATDGRAVERDTPVRLVGFEGLTAVVEPMARRSGSSTSHASEAARSPPTRWQRALRQGRYGLRRASRRQPIYPLTMHSNLI